MLLLICGSLLYIKSTLQFVCYRRWSLLHGREFPHWRFSKGMSCTPYQAFSSLLQSFVFSKVKYSHSRALILIIFFKYNIPIATTIGILYCSSCKKLLEWIWCKSFLICPLDSCIEAVQNTIMIELLPNVHLLILEKSSCMIWLHYIFIRYLYVWKFIWIISVEMVREGDYESVSFGAVLCLYDYNKWYALLLQVSWT